MKTSLLNRLQSPLPSAENTPQTSPVNTSEITGFSGLFQKAIGWLSPKTTSNGSSDITALTSSAAVPPENTSIILSGLQENTNPVSLLTPLINNGSKEIAEGLTDVLPMTPENILLLADKGVSVLNMENEKLIEQTNSRQIFVPQSTDFNGLTPDEFEVITLNGAVQIPLIETQESNLANNLLTQQIDNEYEDVIPQNEEIEKNNTSPVHLDDVVASVYAAIQTNLPAENVDVTFLPTGKNSAEITLVINSKF
ncbi:MAG: hypothetical protein HYZ54_13145 [Ignavibacteriae bacterium]|nr:hypothetical protein [Ignavibacteriota bacterium]